MTEYQSTVVVGWPYGKSRSNKPPKPIDIPQDPYKVYRDEGWVSWGDWLGTGAIATKDRVSRPFEEARAFVHKLQLKGETEWRKYH